MSYCLSNSVVWKLQKISLIKKTCRITYSFEDIEIKKDRRLTDNAIAGIRRRSEKSVTWHVQIQHWNDQFETWELMNQSAFRTDVSTEKNQTVAKLRFIRRIRTKHLKIHVANAPQNTFTIAFQTAR